jgi:hypothetical protein
MTLVEETNRAGGTATAQVFPRPMGLVVGLELAERVAEMRKPERKLVRGRQVESA